jgi:hypothetical protein
MSNSAVSTVELLVSEGILYIKAKKMILQQQHIEQIEIMNTSAVYLCPQLCLHLQGS